jgi:galactonate dehydratase
MHRRNFLASSLGTLAAYTALVRDGRAAGTSRVPKLKVTKIRAVRMRGMNSRFVRVYTDQGLTGTGETLDTVGAEDLINNNFGPALEGRDPLDIEGIYFNLLSYDRVHDGKASVFLRGAGGGPFYAALAGIEIALWDLAGKALDVPLYRLFGGRMRDKVAVYFHSNDPKTVGEMVRSTKVKAFKTSVDLVTQRGNDAKGLDPGKVSLWSLTNRQIDDISEHVGAMRQAVGPDIEVALECHTRYDVESAIQIAKAVEQFRPMWLEEAVPSDNPAVMAAVRRATRIPIACGENVYTRFGFRPFLEEQAVSLIQPDMSKAGGLLEGKKIAAMAEVYHIPIAPHGVATTLGKTAFAHVCATVPNFLILEWGGGIFNKQFTGLTTDADYRDGFVHLPDKPGIGIEVNEAAVKELLEPGYEL